MSEEPHDDDVELAMTEAEWERWQREQPPGRPDAEHEPAEPWAVGESHERGWLGWLRR